MINWGIPYGLMLLTLLILVIIYEMDILGSSSENFQVGGADNYITIKKDTSGKIIPGKGPASGAQSNDSAPRSMETRNTSTSSIMDSSPGIDGVGSNGDGEVGRGSGVNRLNAAPGASFEQPSSSVHLDSRPHTIESSGDSSQGKFDISDLKEYLASKIDGTMSFEGELDKKNRMTVELPAKVDCHTHEDCNIVFGDGQNKCLNGTCRCEIGSGRFCHKKPNYYKELREMTPAQIIKFKKTARPDRMTLGDYKNWLLLWQYDIENLPKHHMRNFHRLMQNLPIYDIPLADPVDEFLAEEAAKKDKVCMEIPNAEVDSPLNWKIHAELNNNAEIDQHGNTAKDLNWSRYFKHPQLSSEDSATRTDSISVKNWFMDNVNWMFTDVDRNTAIQNPDQNRFMNIIDSPNTRLTEGQVKSDPTMSNQS